MEELSQICSDFPWLVVVHVDNQCFPRTASYLNVGTSYGVHHRERKKAGKNVARHDA